MDKHVAENPNAIEKCPNPGHFDKNLKDPYRWQAHILHWPDVFRDKSTRPNEKQKAPIGTITRYIVGGLTERVGQFFFWESNIAKLYQYGIERTWGLNPKPRRSLSAPWEYTNRDRTGGANATLRVDEAKMRWSDLRKLYQAGTKLPLWILNTTQGHRGVDSNLDDLYELTPFGHGSTRLGYKTYRKDTLPFPKNMAQGVAASGAVLDKQGTGTNSLGPTVALTLARIAFSVIFVGR